MSFDLAAQKAIFEKLRSDATLRSLTGSRITDFVPQKQTFPFVSIGEDSITEFDSSSTDGCMLLATIHTWSNAKGRKECKEIQSRVRAVLHKASMSASGYTIHFCHWQSSQSFIDADGTTRHGVCIYNLYITEE